MVSIILPAYVPNAELLEVTKRCIRSLDETTEITEFEFIIVDNGSYPSASAWLSRNWADAIYTYDEPLGYARAANIGLATAKGEWLLVVNTDIEFLEAGWLERMIGDYLQTKGGILSAMDDGRKGIVYDESWFSCWLTHRLVVQQLGYFDESLNYRYHDQDYAIKARRAGYGVMRTGSVPVKHINSATYDTMGRDEDPDERDAMIERWGASLYVEWLKRENLG